MVEMRLYAAANEFGVAELSPKPIFKSADGIEILGRPRVANGPPAAVAAALSSLLNHADEVGDAPLGVAVNLRATEAKNRPALIGVIGGLEDLFLGQGLDRVEEPGPCPVVGLDQVTLRRHAMPLLRPVAGPRPG